ncbi:hypothetical protein LR48_Vigan01g161600 [Vigna angularis]|uniref:Uncharacterized protein n=1 Tax=Phaseolus angularis TaxID=3914 RepID=A0A0L9TNC9_PHAAN|nr:hypothetical protein LR48_Vigan01g161600 [Vigna angularis]
MDGGESVLNGKVGSILIAIGTASFFITVFHLIILCRTHHRVRVINHNPQQQPRRGNISVSPHLIPIHTYRKEKKSHDEVPAEGDALIRGSPPAPVAPFAALMPRPRRRLSTLRRRLLPLGSVRITS